MGFHGMAALDSSNKVHGSCRDGSQRACELTAAGPGAHTQGYRKVPVHDNVY